MGRRLKPHPAYLLLCLLITSILVRRKWLGAFFIIIYQYRFSAWPIYHSTWSQGSRPLCHQASQSEVSKRRPDQSQPSKFSRSRTPSNWERVTEAAAFPALLHVESLSLWRSYCSLQGGNSDRQEMEQNPCKAFFLSLSLSAHIEPRPFCIGTHALLLRIAIGPAISVLYNTATLPLSAFCISRPALFDTNHAAKSPRGKRTKEKLAGRVGERSPLFSPISTDTGDWLTVRVAWRFFPSPRL